MTHFTIRPIHELEPAHVHTFYIKAFGRSKADFLMTYGEWWHRYSQHRYAVVTDTGEIAGYHAAIEGDFIVAGQIQHGLWWMDLHILSKYRGQGLQSLLDRQIRALNIPLFGFPNTVAIDIHRKHGWGVNETGRYMKQTFSRRAEEQVQWMRGLTGRVARIGARLEQPLIQLRALRNLARWDTEHVTETRSLDKLPALATLSVDDQTVTTYRNHAYFDWKYGQCPFPDQFRIYRAADGNDELAMITRRLYVKKVHTLRIEDYMGSLHRADLFTACVIKALADSLRQGIEQALIVTTRPEYAALLEELGFRSYQPLAFCWYSAEPGWIEQVTHLKSHWVFADSDLSYLL